MSKIVTLVLVTGQELVAKQINETADCVVLQDPLVFQQMRHPENGQIVSGLAEWPALADPKKNNLYSIPKSAVLVMPLIPHEDLERQYIANTSGLALPAAVPKILHG